MGSKIIILDKYYGVKFSCADSLDPCEMFREHSALQERGGDQTTRSVCLAAFS